MPALPIYFTNPIPNRLTDDKLQKFSLDHLGRITPLPAYAALSTATQAAYEDFFGAITKEATATALREARTKAVEGAVAAIRESLSRAEGSIRGAFGEKSAEYQEFFPRGLTEYSKANLANLRPLLDRFVAAANVDGRAAQLPADFAAKFAQLGAQFDHTRKAQLAKKEAVGSGKVGTKEARQALIAQLHRNVLAIALENIGNPKAGLALFDAAQLKAPAKAKKTPAPAAA